MKKRVLTALFAVSLAGLMVIAGCQTSGAKGGAMKPGTYNAQCNGYYGDFNVSVTVTANAITTISAGDYKETPAVGGKAISILIDRIIEANTSGVDNVSGATITSIAFKAAVTDCLQQAKAGPAFTAAPAKPEQKNVSVTTDVLVVGAGGAGFSAAIAAAENGAKVTLIEKQDITGGSTVVSAGIVYAATDPADYAKMTDYYMARSEGKADRTMLRFFAERSLDTIAFLESIWVKWMMTIPAGTAPEPRARFSMHDDGTFMIGSSLIDPLEKKAKDMGVTILTGVRGTELTLDAQGKISGAKAAAKGTNYTINTRAVILTTGGFDASEEMKAQYSPIAVKDFPISNKGNTGDGIKMGIAAGAETVFNGGVIGFQFINPALPESGNNAAAIYSGLYVRPDGSFVAPPQDYPILYTTLKKDGGEKYFGVHDSKSWQLDAAKKAVTQGFGWTASTIEDLAKATGMDAAKLAAAFKNVPQLVNPPYIAVEVRACTIGSMGGLKTNTSAEVLKKGSTAAIPGLYAAGETANGSFYYQEYPASGTSNSLCVTFGREAGKNAAAYIRK